MAYNKLLAKDWKNDSDRDYAFLCIHLNIIIVRQIIGGEK